MALFFAILGVFVIAMFIFSFSSVKIPTVKTMLWGNHFWSPSYCVVSCGGVALDVVREYINNQNEPPSEKAMKTSQALKQRKE